LLVTISFCVRSILYSRMANLRAAATFATAYLSTPRYTLVSPKSFVTFRQRLPSQTSSLVVLENENPMAKEKKTKREKKKEKRVLRGNSMPRKVRRNGTKTSPNPLFLNIFHVSRYSRIF
jgi:hypothetical protein